MSVGICSPSSVSGGNYKQTKLEFLMIYGKNFTSSSFVSSGSAGTIWSVIVTEKKRFLFWLTKNCFYITILLYNSNGNEPLNIIGYFKPIVFSFSHSLVFLFDKNFSDNYLKMRITFTLKTINNIDLLYRFIFLYDRGYFIVGQLERKKRKIVLQTSSQ